MKKLLLFLVLFSLSAFLFPYPANAQTTNELNKQLEDKQAEIQKLESQLTESKKQEKTLKSQLNLIDGQTQVTVLKIEETSLKIEKLKREISDLSTRIERIGTTLDKLSEILLSRIIQTYKYSNTISTIDLLFSSHGFADLIERLKYIQVAQSYDKKKLYELQATKLAYNDQKQDKQTRQVEAEKLNKDLESYKGQLAQQKKDKEELMKITKNDEARFQSLITQLKADADSIARAISNIGARIGPVSKGEVIASEGLTGCTSGPHLHFGVYENAKVENNQIVDKNTGTPARQNIWNYLRNPRDFIDTGRLGPPMQGYPNFTHVSVEFGNYYDLGRHTGIDIYDNAYIGTPLLAADNGIAYTVGDSGCPGLVVDGVNYDHGPAKGIIIDHQNGIVTLYWHIP